MASYCPPTYKYPSLNVENMTVGMEEFSYTKDHSKFGISTDRFLVLFVLDGRRKKRFFKNKITGEFLTNSFNVFMLPRPGQCFSVCLYR